MVKSNTDKYSSEWLHIPGYIKETIFIFEISAYQVVDLIVKGKTEKRTVREEKRKEIVLSHDKKDLNS